MSFRENALPGEVLISIRPNSTLTLEYIAFSVISSAFLAAVFFTIQYVWPEHGDQAINTWILFAITLGVFIVGRLFQSYCQRDKYWHDSLRSNEELETRVQKEQPPDQNIVVVLTSASVASSKFSPPTTTATTSNRKVILIPEANSVLTFDFISWCILSAVFVSAVLFSIQAILSTARQQMGAAWILFAASTGVFSLIMLCRCLCGKNAVQLKTLHIYKQTEEAILQRLTKRSCAQKGGRPTLSVCRYILDRDGFQEEQVQMYRQDDGTQYVVQQQQQKQQQHQPCIDNHHNLQTCEEAPLLNAPLSRTWC